MFNKQLFAFIQKRANAAAFSRILFMVIVRRNVNSSCEHKSVNMFQRVCAGSFFCEKRKNVRNSAACGYCFYVVFVYFKSAFFVFIRRKNSYNGFREKFLLKLIWILDIFSAFQYYYPTFYCYLQVLHLLFLQGKFQYHNLYFPFC